MNKITNKLKQLFSICLIFILIVSMFPGAVGAEEDNESSVEDTETVEDESSSSEEENEDTSDAKDSSEEEKEESEDSDELADEEDEAEPTSGKENDSTGVDDQKNEDKVSKDSEDKESDKEDTASEEKASEEPSDKESNDTQSDKPQEEKTSEPKNKEKDSTSEEYDEESVRAEVKKAIEQTKAYYEDNNPYKETIWDGVTLYNGSHSDYWVLSALWGAGYKDLKNDFEWGDASPWTDGNYWTQEKEELWPNEAAGVLVGSVMLNKDLSEFGDRDIIAEVLEGKKDNGLYANGIEEEVILFIGLDMLEVEYDRESHIQAIVDQQLDDGSFTEFTKSDAIGWTMMALAPYKDDYEEVEEMMDRSVEWIHDQYMNSDAFEEGGTEANSNSIAAIIMGLVSIDEDIYSDKWLKDNVSFVDLLLELQHEDGWFWWMAGSEGAKDMATSQSLVALTTADRGQTPFVEYLTYGLEGEGEDSSEDTDNGENESETGEEIETGDETEKDKNETESEKKSTDDVELNSSDNEKNIEQAQHANVQDQEIAQSQNGEKLPDTATNMYNFITIGLILLVTGILTVVVRKRAAKVR